MNYTRAILEPCNAIVRPRNAGDNNAARRDCTSWVRMRRRIQSIHVTFQVQTSRDTCGIYDHLIGIVNP